MFVSATARLARPSRSSARRSPRPRPSPSPARGGASSCTTSPPSPASARAPRRASRPGASAVWKTPVKKSPRGDRPLAGRARARRAPRRGRARRRAGRTQDRRARSSRRSSRGAAPADRRPGPRRETRSGSAAAGPRDPATSLCRVSAPIGDHVAVLADVREARAMRPTSIEERGPREPKLHRRQQRVARRQAASRPRRFPRSSIA